MCYFSVAGGFFFLPLGDIPALGVIKGAEQNAHDVDELPDAEKANGDELQKGGEDLARIQAMHPTKPSKAQEGQYECDRTRPR